ncbi:protein toll-like [Ischnura elegans]|uniref:protein toll-like n=1 Tax=Ischnura elegans TaxID=197161 RepID=UPI001ED87752|nr:protein toll-like [Ischnura elegans]XP_046405208.1 protein toll-like [Ischnura elegans]
MTMFRERHSNVMKAKALTWAIFVILLFGHCLGDISSWKKRNEERSKHSVGDSCSHSRRDDGSYEVECFRQGRSEKKQDESFITSSSQVVRAQVSPGRHAKIQCSDLTHWEDLDLIAGLDIGNCPTVQFYLCPLPASSESTGKRSFKEFFDVIGAKNVTDLEFQSYLMLNDTLTAKHLEGLIGLRNLYLRDNGLTKLPGNLFSGAPDLKWIDLRGNSIVLPSSIFQDLPNLEVLELGSNGITSLPPDIFRGLTRLKLLNIWQNKLGETNLSRTHFLGLTALNSLDLNSNGIKMLSPGIFHDLRALKNLNLNSNNLSSIPADLFINNVNLTKLRLNDNRVPIRTLPLDLFSNLTKLKELSLESCGLEWLLKGFLKGLVDLVSVSFHNNKLRSLPETMFSGLSNLKTINLSNNLLSLVPESLFEGLKALKSLHLERNRLEMLPEKLLNDLSSLEELDLSDNYLKDIPRSMFSHVVKLRKLYLSHNQLSFPDPLGGPSWPNSPFHYCTELKVLEIANNSLQVIFSDWQHVITDLNTLNLSNNSIQTIAANDLQFTSNNIHVDLSNNNISLIDFKAAETLARAQEQPKLSKKNVVVILDNNPLNCDCKVYDLLRYVEGRMAPQVNLLFNVKTDNLYCASPQNIMGKPVRSLSSSNLTCDSDLPQLTELDEEMLVSIWNDTEQALKVTGSKCPRRCYCLDRPEDHSLVVNCSGSNLTSLPVALPVVSWSNYTELHAEGLGLQKLWAPWSLPIGYDRVRVLRLGRNSLTHLDVMSLPPHLDILELHQNNFTHLGKDVIAAVSNSSQIALHDNPWSCDCEAMDLLNFVQEHFKQVTVLSNVTCGSGSHYAKPFSQLTVNDICPLPTAIIVAACTSLAVIGIVFGTLAALYYRHQHVIKVWLFSHNLCLWLITEDELDKDKQYDAFISYSHQDEDFVVNELVPGLEGGRVSGGKSTTGENACSRESSPDEKKDIASYKLCLHFRDWVAGEWIPAQIARSVDSSCRTIVVLSPAFLESVWGQMEFRAAHCRALSEGRTRVIVILYGDVPPTESLDPELRAYLTTNTYVKWGDPWFWQKLRYAMPHFPRKPYKKVPSSASVLEMNMKNLHNGNGQCKPFEVIPTNHVPTDDSTTIVT